MSQTIKIDFVDFWPGLLKHDNYFFSLLSQKYQVIIDDVDPDIVFMSCYSMDKVRYQNHRCKKVFFTGENRGPQCVHGGQWADVSFEYDLTFTFDETNNKNTYLPLFVLFINWFNTPHHNDRDISFLADLDDLLKPLENDQEFLRSKTHGCCFLAKNPTAMERINFCIEAQKSFPVDCAGPVLNNHPQIGGRGDQIQKIDFIRKYRSIVAFENSKHSGYLTEKALHGVCTRCVPIYWGANYIFKYFNENSVIIADNWQTAIKQVARILESDEQYLDMVRGPALKRSILDEFNPERILSRVMV